MKRYGFLIEKVIDKDNLSNAFDAVLQGKKRNRTTRYFKRNKYQILDSIADEIEIDNYSPSGFHEFSIIEHEKERTIQSLPFRDRIALHAIMNVLGDIFNNMLIRDTYSSLPNRGIHDGLNRVKKALLNREGTKYCLKIDLRKFYHSVDQVILIDMLKRKIKDARMINTLERIIRKYDKGLPIGFHSSQLLGNFYLFPLDYYVKMTLNVRYYFRYCDDIVILTDSKEELRSIFEKMKILIEEKLHLSIKNNYQIFPVESRGIDFLGYVIRHDYVHIRKHIKQRAARRLKVVRSKRRRTAIIGSFYGWAKHCNSNHLLYKLIGMKDFKELGISYQPTDGKKRFEGNLTSLGTLQNLDVIILDFETDIKTKEGEGRYVVQYEKDGIKGKFITNSEEMKNILDQVRAADALPFKTTIRRETFGQGKTKYVFT